VKDSPEHPAERTGHAGHADHGSEGAGHGSKTGERIVHLLVHAADEFLSMGAYLIVGAAVAGLLQTAAPAGSLAFFRGSAALSVGFMIALAVVLSICSEADAFVAASFIRFTPAAQLAFLTTGPVVDIKLISMFLGTFRREAVLVLVSVPLIMNFVLCLLLALLF